MLARIECQRSSSHKTTLTSVQKRRLMHHLGQHNQNGPVPFADLLPYLKTRLSFTCVETLKKNKYSLLLSLDSKVCPCKFIVEVVHPSEVFLYNRYFYLSALALPGCRLDRCDSSIWLTVPHFLFFSHWMSGYITTYIWIRLLQSVQNTCFTRVYLTTLVKGKLYKYTIERDIYTKSRTPTRSQIPP